MGEVISSPFDLGNLSLTRTGGSRPPPPCDFQNHCPPMQPQHWFVFFAKLDSESEGCREAVGSPRAQLGVSDQASKARGLETLPSLSGAWLRSGGPLSPPPGSLRGLSPPPPALTALVWHGGVPGRQGLGPAGAGHLPPGVTVPGPVSPMLFGAWPELHQLLGGLPGAGRLVSAAFSS